MRPMWVVVCFAAAGMVGVGGCAAGGREKREDVMSEQAAGGALGGVAFMSGTWREWREGALIEESWSAAHGGGMVGWFRWCRPDGSVMVYELLGLSREPAEGDADVVFLRLRHFSSKLVAKEEKDAPMTLKLVRGSAAEAEFAAHAHCGDVTRIVYRVAGDGVLRVRVEFSEASGRKGLEFVYRKQ